MLRVLHFYYYRVDLLYKRDLLYYNKNVKLVTHTVLYYFYIILQYYFLLFYYYTILLI